jgi:uncharacterized damage-inducible protein DinB
MPRTDPDTTGTDELAMLGQFLDYHRATLVGKASGLDGAGLAARAGTSSLTLGGLLAHAALNEDHWFSVILLGRTPSEPWASAPWADDPDWEFTTAADRTPADLLAAYESTCEQSRANVAEAYADGGLDRESTGRSSRGERFTLRWILLHMLEETARHNGHADLLRESVDGVTGE